MIPAERARKDLATSAFFEDDHMKKLDVYKTCCNYLQTSQDW